MRKYIFILGLLLLTVFEVRGQKCATKPFYEHLESRHSNFEKELEKHLNRARKTSANEEIYNIPVVVHVLHDDRNGNVGGAFNSNISEEQIQSQIDVLNLDFRRENTDTVNTPSYFTSLSADIKIEFCLATNDPEGNPTNGITRTYSNELPFSISTNVQIENLTSLAYWPSDQYLNIWVTELTNSILGQAQFPSGTNYDGLSQALDGAETDGVIMDHRYFGNDVGSVSNNPYPQYRLGRTLTHEVGHWLGLLHIWGDYSSCSATDYCNDTPSQTSNNGGLPRSECSDAVFECGSEIMYMNYMDYTQDFCLNLFTQDQKARMRGSIEIDPRRNALLSSTGCCGSSKRFSLPFVEAFDEDFTSNFWSVEVSNKSSVVYELDERNTSINIDYTEDGYVQLQSQVVDFRTAKLPYFYLDIEQSKLAFDSIVFAYDRSCKNEWTTFKTLSVNDFSIQDYYDINLYRAAFYASDLASLGFLSFRITIYGNKDLKIQRFEAREFTDESIKVFPNPTEGTFTIQNNYLGKQNVKVEIYDLTGRLVQVFVGDTEYEHNYIINFDPEMSGLYLLKVSVGEKVYKHKLLVE